MRAVLSALAHLAATRARVRHPRQVSLSVSFSPPSSGALAVAILQDRTAIARGVARWSRPGRVHLFVRLTPRAGRLLRLHARRTEVAVRYTRAGAKPIALELPVR